MTSGIPYDSDEGRAICGALTAIMTGVAYATSAEMAKELGTFPSYEPNAEHMLRVIRNHRLAAHGETEGYEGLAVNPVALIAEDCPDQDLITHARAAWDKALELGEKHGYRNAQSTVIAPTGTIGLVMDCDTTGIEPDFALVKFSWPVAATSRSSTAPCRKHSARSATQKARSPKSKPMLSVTATSIRRRASTRLR